MPQELFNNARSRMVGRLKDIIALLEETEPTLQPMDGHAVFISLKDLDGDTKDLIRSWNAARSEFIRINEAQSMTIAAKRRRLVFEQRFIRGRKIREIAKELGKGVSTINYDIHRHVFRLSAYASKRGMPYLGTIATSGRRHDTGYAVYNQDHQSIFTSDKLETVFPVLAQELQRMNIDPLEYIRLV